MPSWLNQPTQNWQVFVVKCHLHLQMCWRWCWSCTSSMPALTDLAISYVYVYRLTAIVVEILSNPFTNRSLLSCPTRMSPNWRHVWRVVSSGYVRMLLLSWIVLIYMIVFWTLLWAHTMVMSTNTFSSQPKRIHWTRSQSMHHSTSTWNRSWRHICKFAAILLDMPVIYSFVYIYFINVVLYFL